MTPQNRVTSNRCTRCPRALCGRVSVVFIVLAFCWPVGAEPVVKWWISSQDMRSTFARQSDLAFSRTQRPSDSSIVVDENTTYQTIIGLGSSLEHSTCYNISLLSPARQEEVIESLVDKDKGIGMNLMRICFGTADFTASPWYSYDDPPENRPDPELRHFSIDKDTKYVLPVLKLALKINPDLQFFASPWSPPAWMKTNGSMCGGHLAPEHYEAYAKYLARSILAYQAEGLDIIAITPQNEPEYFPETYPTCGWTAQQQRDFIRDHLGPVLAEHRLATKIWCYDHNFNHPNFPATILADPQAARYIDGTGFHHYEGRPSAMTWLHEKFPDKHIYFTEGSVFGLGGAVEIISYLRNWARSYNAWVTMIDHKAQPNPGPHDCSPTCVVLDSDTLKLEYGFDYYVYGHFMKHIQRGAVRIDSTDSESTPNVAVRNPDGSIVLVVANIDKTAQTLSVVCGPLAFQTELTGQSIATLTWKPSGP